MTKDRAKQILSLKSDVTGLSIIVTGNARKHMTDDEIKFVNDKWDTLAGHHSFASTLRLISKGK